jgi:hypothetical protein
MSSTRGSCRVHDADAQSVVVRWLLVAAQAPNVASAANMMAVRIMFIVLPANFADDADTFIDGVMLLERLSGTANERRWTCVICDSCG